MNLSMEHAFSFKALLSLIKFPTKALYMPDFNDRNTSNSNVVVIDFERGAMPKNPSPSSELNVKKRQIFTTWLSQGTVSVLLDARAEGVKVPPAFAGHSELILNFSYDFHVPDFNFNDVAVWATLSFDDGEYFCMVPWPSVLGMQSAALVKAARWFVDFDEVSDESENSQSENELDLLPQTRSQGKVISFDFNNKKTI